VTATLLGIQTLSLVVQIAGMLGSASQFTLSAIWISVVAVGGATLLLQVPVESIIPLASNIRYAWFPLAIISTAMLADLLVAMSPSTKIDELYYHMLVPSRIVSDGAIHFYRMPWEAAIWPQMAYQTSSAPMHAIGYPDAANVVSWTLSAMLVWFAWRVIVTNTRSPLWSAFWAAALCVGMYPVVWHVTGGAHAMGDLAMAAAIVAFASSDRLFKALTPTAYGVMVSILLISAATSKVSLLPACAVLLCLTAWQTLHSAPSKIARDILLSFTIPWLLLYCPILVWTWIHSGSPFGPLLAGAFGSSVYSDGWMQETIRATRQVNQPSLYVTGTHAILNYSPLVWLGVIGAVLGTNLPRTTRAALGLLFALQTTLIYFVLPYDPRFLGGIHYGLLIVFASHASRNIHNIITRPRLVVVGCMILLLPWLGIQLYYAKQFFLISFGFERKQFYQKYIAFYDDYDKLDRLLTDDTVILARDYRFNSVYAPRPIFFDPLDLPTGKRVVLLSSARRSDALGGFKRGQVIYSNPQAVVATYRTPGSSPITDWIQVTELRRD
jgi:hypothetical protein